ncbi:MAG: CBS domain-containing protein [Gammaproteobacteria bacterium]|nr:CBS domain-containing protein [Gammaproteobacteria bacterium]NND40415.1 CBS domain-containing protein [Pseudomonadales bacterium]MBT8150703.1 CBS domain-containing protein [Gammaproteobacteria bacterium]NNL11847.1 CBS domain-containing protein [Pseudomonadales bacterium]NNM11113.1 CBS domain-containing protein [Pseudomonadales bacterium]
MQTRRVRDFMARHYATVKPGQTLAAAVRVLLEYHQSAVPVVDEQHQMVGLLSEADCMRTTLVEGYFNEGVTLVKDLMTAEPDTVSPDLELSAVSERFLQNKRRMMPVVEAGTLVGIVQRHDILKALI